jgi:hypothetical protein
MAEAFSVQAPLIPSPDYVTRKRFYESIFVPKTYRKEGFVLKFCTFILIKFYLAILYPELGLACYFKEIFTIKGPNYKLQYDLTTFCTKIMAEIDSLNRLQLPPLRRRENTSAGK